MVEQKIAQSGWERDGLVLPVPNHLLPQDEVPPLAALPPHSAVPFQPSLQFVNRATELKRLARILSTEPIAIVTQVAGTADFGGTGKTELALAFAHRYGAFFSGGVFWINMSQPDTIAAQVALYGGPNALDLQPDFNRLPQARQLELVRAIWQSDEPRLLIFDNCPDQAILADWRPETGQSRVLVTSRNDEWEGLPVSAILVLGRLGWAEGTYFLRQLAPNYDSEALEALARQVEGLPLALRMAGCYLAQLPSEETTGDRAAVAYGQAIAQKIEDAQLLPLEHTALPGTTIFWPSRSELLAASTFVINREKLDPGSEIDRLAHALLVRAAAFAPGQPIPRDWLLASLNRSPNDRYPKDVWQLLVRAAWKRLVRLGLLTEPAPQMGMLHQMHAAFIQNYIAWIEARNNARTAVEWEVLTRLRQFNESGDRAAIQQNLIHILPVTQAATVRRSPAAAPLWNSLGYHWQQVGDTARAERAFDRSLQILQQSHGELDPELATLYHNLARVFQDQGDYDQAQAAYEKAYLARRDRGIASIEAALVLNDLGQLFHYQGDLPKAQVYLSKSLNILNSAVIPDHPWTGTIAANLGWVLKARGNYAAAEVAFEQALAVAESRLGPAHPRVVAYASHLAAVLRAQGKSAESQPVLQRVAMVRAKAPSQAPDALEPNHVMLERPEGVNGWGADYQAGRTSERPGEDLNGSSVAGDLHPLSNL